MATAMVLSSRDSLTLIHRNPSRNSHASKTTIPRRHKQVRPPKKTTTATVVKPLAANSNLVMGQVKILKRGETLPAEQSDLMVSSIKRIGPEPKMMQKQMRAFKGLEIVPVDYAGSGCCVSPPPSSVPMPAFLAKN